MAGYVIIRQRPATAKGFAFMTIEDEDGTVNVVLRPGVYKKYRQVFKLEPLIVVEGIVQKRDGILNVIADTLFPLYRLASNPLPGVYQHLTPKSPAEG